MSIVFSKIKDSVPLTPGVYFFRNSAGTILYIGKAANLRSRLSSYFMRGAALEAAKRRMREEAVEITWQEVPTEIEALLLEALLIKKHLPPYNIALRDDKQYLFVGFTKEQFPRLVFTHQPIAFAQTQSGKLTKVEFFGPFTEGGAIKQLLRSLRKTFPYCTCKSLHERRCQQAELKLCLGICCMKNHNASKEERVVYQKNTRFIKNILAGRQQQLLKRLKTDMRRVSKNQNFETAAVLRDQTYALGRIFAHRHIVKTDFAAENQRGLHELRMLLGLQKTPERIEGYDISNIQGTHAVGSMVVFADGTADKSAYRKFQIRTVRGANDPAMIHEVIVRRLKHIEWPLPDIMLIDGGRTQLQAARHAFAKGNLAPGTPSEHTHIVSIAKREEELYTPARKMPFKLKEMPLSLLHLLQQIRNESHRFAISYYRKRHRMQAKHP
ncbi:MAG: GIY-YIG nuclease family protein [Patescibacteria group bacterium]